MPDFTERQNLPIALPCTDQPVDKSVCFRSEIAGTERTWQRCRVQQYAAGTIRQHIDIVKIFTCMDYSEARRIVPPASGDPLPWLIGSDRFNGAGNFSKRYNSVRLWRNRRSKLATECEGL